MSSPTKDSSTHGGGLGSSSSPANRTQENETRTPTSTEVEPSQTPPLSPAPPFTSSGGVYEITSDVATNPPHPPPPPPFIPPATSSVGSSSGRKRGRDGDPSEQDPIKCVVCGKEFWSEKSYYGHLRKHPDRQWRGAYPPTEVKNLGPTLLELANQTIARMSGRGPSRGGLAINLSPTPPPPPPPPPTSGVGGGTLPFDLNMPPPPEDDDEEADEGRDHGHHPSHSDA